MPHTVMGRPGLWPLARVYFPPYPPPPHPLPVPPFVWRGRGSLRQCQRPGCSLPSGHGVSVAWRQPPAHGWRPHWPQGGQGARRRPSGLQCRGGGDDVTDPHGPRGRHVLCGWPQVPQRWQHQGALFQVMGHGARFPMRGEMPLQSDTSSKTMRLLIIKMARKWHHKCWKNKMQKSTTLMWYAFYFFYTGCDIGMSHL